MKHITSIVVFGISLIFTASAAQEAFVAEARPKNGVITESFDTYANVSAPYLVGLTIGQTDQGFDPMSVRIGASNLEESELCVVTTSRDGRYYAESVYIGEPDAEAWRLNPVSKKFSNVLGDYASDQVAFRAFLPDDNGNCFEATNTYWPRITTPTNQLTIYLNSENRLTKVVANNGNGEESFVSSQQGECHLINDYPLVTFDTICTLAIGSFAPKGLVKIEYKFVDAFGSEENVFLVSLPNFKGE